MATVIDRQPGMASSREMSGSVQYIGGYIGPMDEAGLQDEDTSKTLVPMGLEVFEKVDKLVATQIVSSDEGKSAPKIIPTPRGTLELSGGSVLRKQLQGMRRRYGF